MFHYYLLGLTRPVVDFSFSRVMNLNKSNFAYYSLCWVTFVLKVRYKVRSAQVRAARRSRRCTANADE